MTGRQKRRLIAVLTILAGTAAAAALTIAAFRENMLFFYTPSQLVTGEAKVLVKPGGDEPQLFRMGGLVEKVWREPGGLEVRFTVTDTAHAVTVSYTGLLPDLFREGQGVVVRGHWENGMLIAGEVLAKHDENYMPPEADDALRAAKTLQGGN